MFAVYSCDLTVCGVCFVPMPARQSFLILGIFIFRRCHSRYLLEQAGEVLLVCISQLPGCHADRIIFVPQHLLSHVQPHQLKVFVHAFSGLELEQVAEIAR